MPGLLPVKFKLTIAYDGTGYAGWQAQKTGVGVQQRVEEAIGKIFPGRVAVCTVPAAPMPGCMPLAWPRKWKFRTTR